MLGIEVSVHKTNRAKGKKMKISYAVKNLRSLQQMPCVELRPITILVGRNGGGKSTFLRSFPLLRQSITVRSSAPILWYGQYVDYGDFNAAVSQGNSDNTIGFEFICEDIEIHSHYSRYWSLRDSYRYGRYTNRDAGRQKYSKVRYYIELGHEEDRTVRRRIELEIPEQNISLSISFENNEILVTQVYINGINFSEMFPNYELYMDDSDIFADILMFQEIKSNQKTEKIIVNPLNAFGGSISNIIRPKVDGRVGKKSISIESRKMLRFPKLSNKTISLLIKDCSIKLFQEFYSNLIRDKKTLKIINTTCAMNYCMQVMADVGNLFRNIYSNTIYLGPARARSERYYRLQELEISEIASDGHNLPMLLNSLDPADLSKFSNWTKKFFGFEVDIQRSEGHISIVLIKSEKNVNITDTGYGFSQLLPVLAQIWWSSIVFPNHRGDISSSNTRIIAMEQPELHLHPAHQAGIADTLIATLENIDENYISNPLFIVETHSESFINRLGELIEYGKLSPNDIQILIFSNENDNPYETNVKTSSFDENGALIDWPHGFFNYDY